MSAFLTAAMTSRRRCSSCWMSVRTSMMRGCPLPMLSPSSRRNSARLSVLTKSSPYSRAACSKCKTVRHREQIGERRIELADRQAVEDAAAVVVHQHDGDVAQVEVLDRQQAVHVVIEGHVADQQHERIVRLRRDAQRRRGVAVDPARAAIAVDSGCSSPMACQTDRRGGSAGCCPRTGGLSSGSASIRS